MTKDTKKIYVNNKKICDELKALIYEKNQIKEDNNLVECREGIDFIEEFGLLTEFQKAKQELIWLKSGGFIIIEKTQALTTIDVNSGKNTMEKDTIYNTTNTINYIKSDNNINFNIDLLTRLEKGGNDSQYYNIIVQPRH